MLQVCRDQPQNVDTAGGFSPGDDVVTKAQTDNLCTEDYITIAGNVT